jgi:hemoglobin
MDTNPLTVKKDITTAEDIKLLVDTFYEKVKADDTIGYIFNDVVKVDWPHHLPRMYAFWEFLLLGNDTYKGNPMEVHQKVHRMTPLKEAHFDRWLKLFSETVDEHFTGLVAEDAKNRASLIVLTWKPKFTT